MPGWSDVAGWIFDRLPTRKESLLNEIKRIENKRQELQTKWLTASPLPGDIDAYHTYGERLQALEERLKTFKA